MQQRLSDLTLRELGRSLRRYQPFIVTVAAVALIATFLPGDPPSGTVEGPVTETQARTGTGSVDGPGYGAPDGERSPDDASATVDTSQNGTAAAASRADAEDGTERTGTVEESTGPPPAVQWAESDPMEAPDCDPETGRLMVPSSSSLTNAFIWAPNCVPVWPDDADNFGETYQGVTEDTITVAIYRPQDDEQMNAMISATGYEAPDEEERRENIEKIIEAFEAHYETYGRTVEWVDVEASGDVNDDAAARADAIRVAEEIGAFASFTSPGTHGGGFAYVEELVARGVMCFHCSVNIPHWEFDEGYLWGTMVSGTGQRVHVSDMIGMSIGDGPAEYAGDPVLQMEERRFGLIQYNTEDDMYGYSPAFYEEQLNRYGISLAEWVDYTLDPSRTQQQSRTMISRLKDAGVTSIICACDPISLAFFTKEATNQQYFPEWILAGGYLTDTALFARTYDQLQWENAFGISPQPTRMDPDAVEDYSNIAWWHHGEDLDSYPHMWELGILYSGVHLAGPDLNAQTFGDGLRSLIPSSGYITRQGVSYGPGVWDWDEYNAQDDVALIWWDPEEPGPDELGAYGTGMYRYEKMGERYRPGEFPTDVSWFDPEETSVIYEERPERDRLPEYPRREPLREP